MTVLSINSLCVVSEGVYCTEASTAGLAPGEWPESIHVDVCGYRTCFLRMHGEYGPDGELQSVDYSDGDGTRVTLFND